MRRYDIPTAITFLFAGLGLGAVLAILFAPRREEPPIGAEQIADMEFHAQERDEEAYASRAV
jgi:hypothetical protein